jgi:hypothetical protein
MRRATLDVMGLFTRLFGEEPKAHRVLLLRSELGRDDVPQNVTWLYPGAAAEKDAFDALVLRLIEDGATVKLEAHVANGGGLDALIDNRRRR